MGVDLRAALVGSDRARSVRGLTAAGGLTLSVLAASVLPASVGAVLEPGLVVVGFGLACWWAYRNSGLAVSVAFVLGPVLARLAYWVAYYSWLRTGRAQPVALPLSFGGRGAWTLWIPLAVLLGVVAFGVGVLLRRVRAFADTGTRSSA